MSISDPLLKELKGIFQKFLNKDPITDSEPCLIIFCEVLESIFYKGMVMHEDFMPPVFGWMDVLADEMDRGDLPRVFPYIRSIDYCRGCKKVTTSVGRFRLLVRCCLFYKCLHVPVEAMVRQIGGRRFNWYLPHSILGHDVLGEILLSVLMQASQLNFQLDVSNARLLDLSWTLGDSCTATFVPCPFLGLTLCAHKKLSIVVRVDRSGVAAEDGKIEPGDLVDEINEHVITADDQGRLKSILAKSKNQPITLRVVKMHYATPEKTHPALIKLIRGSPQLAVDLGGKDDKTKEKANLISMPGKRKKRPLNLSTEKLRRKRKDTSVLMDPSLWRRRHQGGYFVDYLGSHPVGNKGDITMVEAGLRGAIATAAKAIPVTIECRELEVLIATGHQLLFRHNFMAIASCGHSALFPRHFAYMVGNTGDCTSASEFTCHVFLADSDETSAAVLLSLGYGFQRTQCAV